jgi:hypothetical protein
LAFHETHEAPVTSLDVHDPHYQNERDKNGADNGNGDGLQKTPAILRRAVLPYYFILRLHLKMPVQIIVYIFLWRETPINSSPLKGRSVRPGPYGASHNISSVPKVNDLLPRKELQDRMITKSDKYVDCKNN